MMRDPGDHNAEELPPRRWPAPLTGAIALVLILACIAALYAPTEGMPR